MNNYYKYLFVAFLYLVTLVLLTSCDSTEPEKVKSPRDYTWEVDTVYKPNNLQTNMSSIWGSSENNIYMCGHSSGPGGSLWHYDGTTWENIDLFKEVGHGASLTGVHGSSANNVWVVGYQRYLDGTPIPYAINFNGTKWEKKVLDVPTSLYSVYVEGNRDVWVCGSDGIVAHLDPVYSDWQVDTLKVDVPEGAQYDLYSISSTSTKTYVYGNVAEDYGLKMSFYIFGTNGSTWEITDSFIRDNNNIVEWGTNKLYTTSFGKLYTVGFGIWEKTKDGWNKIINESGDYRSFHEKGTDNMILGGSFGKIFHYNGSYWKDLNLPDDEGVHYRGIWIEKNSVTVMGQLLDEYPQKTIVYTGK